MKTQTRNHNGGTIRILLLSIAALLCMGIIAMPVLAEDPPVSDFTSNVTTGMAPLTVQFTDTSTNNPTSWEWFFDDDTDNSFEQNPVHEYARFGTYMVSLTASNDAGAGESMDKEDYITVTSWWAEKSTWNAPDVGTYSVPVLADLDNDGDNDLLVGSYSGVSYGYMNTGTAASPVWTAEATWNAPDVGTYAAPALADLDGDGDYDLLVGESGGTSKAYKNPGSKTSPAWGAWSGWNVPDIGSYAAPTLADLDNDGDNDLLVGSSVGISYGYENTGTASSPVWTAKSAWNVPAYIGAARTRPAFIDIDNDGDYDLLVGCYSGNNIITHAYENTGTNTSPEWTERPSWDSPGGGKYTTPAVADLDNDGDFDMLAGSDDGVSYGYQNTLPPPTGCDLTISGYINMAAPWTLFAREPNDIVINSIKNNGPGTSPATEVLVMASDGFSGRAAVPSLEKGGTTTVTITDPTLRDTAGGSVTYTATLDPDNTVAETNEANNGQTSSHKTVTYNGYKGTQYWAGKEAPKTYLAYDLHGNVIHSFGDSHYVSGKTSNWQTLTWTYFSGTDPNPDDSNDPINVPEGATVKAVRLYIPYCWDYEKEVSGGLTTTTFNGVTVTPVHMETDTSNFGAYAQYEYGLVTYDVTDQYVKNADNVVTFTRTYWNDNSPVNPGQSSSISPAGFTLMVVYENPAETHRQIFINEGWDLLGASVNDYSTTEEEATSYQEFSGMTIDMSKALRADLTTFVPWGALQNSGDTGEGNLFVNGEQIGHNVWNYGERTVGENDKPQVAVDTRDVLSHLNPGGTGNTIAIQSTAGASPCMVAERSFLVVEYPDDTPVPEFPVIAFPVLIIGALGFLAIMYRTK